MLKREMWGKNGAFCELFLEEIIEVFSFTVTKVKGTAKKSWVTDTEMLYS